MAKPKKRKKKPGYVAPAVTVDLDAVLDELGAIRIQLEAGAEASDWGQAQKLLLRFKTHRSVSGSVG